MPSVYLRTNMHRAVSAVIKQISTDCGDGYGDKFGTVKEAYLLLGGSNYIPVRVPVKAVRCTAFAQTLTGPLTYTYFSSIPKRFIMVLFHVFKSVCPVDPPYPLSTVERNVHDRCPCWS